MISVSCKLHCIEYDNSFDLSTRVNEQSACEQPILGSDFVKSLQWRNNERDGVSNHQPHDCFLKRLFRRRSKKTSRLRVTGLREGNSPVTGKFPAQRASYAENVSIWWRHHIPWGRDWYRLTAHFLASRDYDTEQIPKSPEFKQFIIRRISGKWMEQIKSWLD